jgi:hypothetical protein
MFQGLVFGPDLVERFVACRKRNAWHRRVAASGNASCKWLKSNVIGKRCLVVTRTDRGYRCRALHHAVPHVRAWYATLSRAAVDWRRVRELEKALRRSVLFWRDQESSKDDYYSEHLKYHPDSLFVREVVRARFRGERPERDWHGCCCCGAPDEACKRTAAFREGRERFLENLLLPNQ